MSRQQSIIREILEESRRPLSRDEVLERGRHLLPRLGSATVDRAIRKLCDDCTILGIQFPGQPKRYEMATGHEHPHFICRCCERVYDLPGKVKLPQVETPAGFRLTGGEIVYTGECSECTAADNSVAGKKLLDLSYDDSR